MKAAKSQKGMRPPHMEKVYVKVNSDFDSTGYMQPRSITWADGRTFKIDTIKDYRPQGFYRQGAEGACYTVMIRQPSRINWRLRMNSLPTTVPIPIPKT